MIEQIFEDIESKQTPLKYSNEHENNFVNRQGKEVLKTLTKNP